ncbi:hypothetical protein GCM10017667_08170 [Streptomyces filamentosus]|uniref:Uncharacterized protein n=1 Tax=Streptomyces filamentosus TaxID=67294 RepID=A0A919BE53_STRFL|nr:hypothetical protein GCM10017667_08170 [Streptomyces filamentosus]
MTIRAAAAKRAAGDERVHGARVDAARVHAARDGGLRGGAEGAWYCARGGVRRIARGVRAGADTGAPSRRVILPV